MCQNEAIHSLTFESLVRMASDPRKYNGIFIVCICAQMFEVPRRGLTCQLVPSLNLAGVESRCGIHVIAGRVLVSTVLLVFLCFLFIFLFPVAESFTVLTGCQLFLSFVGRFLP